MRYNQASNFVFLIYLGARRILVPIYVEIGNIFYLDSLLSLTHSLSLSLKHTHPFSHSISLTISKANQCLCFFILDPRLFVRSFVRSHEIVHTSSVIQSLQSDKQIQTSTLIRKQSRWDDNQQKSAFVTEGKCILLPLLIPYLNRASMVESLYSFVLIIICCLVQPFGLTIKLL